MKRTKEQKAITLIALIITIVVLLILAAVAISSITNEGILSYAENAAKDYNQAVANEQSTLNTLEDWLYVNVTGITNIYVKFYNDGTLTFSKDNETIEGKSLVQDFGDIKKTTYSNSTDTPWYNIRENITKVEFLTNIVPTSTAYWFSKLNNLTSINNISNLNTTQVTTMRCMFENCEKLTSLDVSNFNTPNVIDMSWMFSTCKGLTSLDVSKFNTTSATRMHGMFADCENLTSLDLGSFNTSNVTRMDFMFRKCKALTSLDLSTFDTANVSNMERMFQECGVTTIFVSDLFVVGENTNGDAMFAGCVNLVGGNGTKMDGVNHDKTWAKVDTAQNKGYFTLKVVE